MTYSREQLREIFYIGLMILVVGLIVFSRLQQKDDHSFTPPENYSSDPNASESFPEIIGTGPDAIGAGPEKKLSVFTNPEQLKQAITDNPI
ncbi:MAG: hypothetical protein AAB019_10120, partial [Planctomycetota bacterium]